VSTLADTAVRMIKASGLMTVVWGDGILVDICFNAGVPYEHPLHAMQKTLAALAKDERFEAFHIRGNDSRGRQRRVRAFKLKEAFR
jgi:hypothetical protein